MSTALTIHNAPSQSVAVRGETLPPMSFQEMMAMGDELVSTGFLPTHFRNGAQVAAVILTGRELGMPPMRAIRSLSLVKGKVVEAADSQLARFKADGGRAVFTTLDENSAVLALRHPNGDEHVESFTMADTKAAGLSSNDNYKKFPKAMLRSRVITAGLKSVGWEGAVGNYDPDEAAAFSDAPAEKWTAPRPSAMPTPVAEPVELPPMTLAEAEATHLPEKLGGKAMGDTKLKVLNQFVTWAGTKDDLTPHVLRMVDGARLVIAKREADMKSAEAAVAVGAATPGEAAKILDAQMEAEDGLPFD